MENILAEISELHARNKRVEAEKAWETSWQRKTFILCITYAFMCFFMNMIGVEKVFINALVPTFGFFLSTLSLGFLKKNFIGNYLEKQK